eukprot:GSMAST32.ASY1.ANO1.1380.1 assembled CDS
MMRKTNKCKMPRLIIIEGNISAGKSTLCHQVGEHLGFATFLEPTTANPFLELYYMNPKKYALALQIWILKQRYITYINALKFIANESNKSNVNGVLLDRSIWSDSVFALKNFQDGNIDQAGFDFYCTLREQLLKELPPPDVMVYLDVSPTECYRRVHCVRKRECEEAIPIAYLNGLHECYLNFISEFKIVAGNRCTVYRKDWSNFGKVNEMANKILDLCSSRNHCVLGSDFERKTLETFIFNDDLVSARLELSSISIPPDLIELARKIPNSEDPSLVTQKEMIIMPAEASREIHLENCRQNKENSFNSKQHNAQISNIKTPFKRNNTENNKCMEMSPISILDDFF